MYIYLALVYTLHIVYATHTNLQLYDEDHLHLAFEYILEGHDVMVLEALQDLHLFLHACPLQA